MGQFKFYTSEINVYMILEVSKLLAIITLVLQDNNNIIYFMLFWEN